MIVESIFGVVFGVVDLIVGLIPSFGSMFDSVINFLSMPSGVVTAFSMAFCFIDVSTISLVFAVYGGTYLLLLGWWIIEWVYKKVPGVD